MDFNDAPEEAAYRQRVRAFLAQHASPAAEDRRGGGSLAHGCLDTAVAWRRKKAEAGFAGILLPAEFGGAGGTIGQQIVYDDEESRFDVPSDVHFMVGTGICAPAIVEYGTEAQKQRYLPPLIRGEEIWCQLFSEPSSGSDLAAVRTRAVKVDGGWTLSGQKIWTSFAHLSQFGLLLGRTDPALPKHAGLTMFIIDMAAPGLSVRPIRQISGQAHFNEVFLDDVFVPDNAVMGQPNKGWAVALTMLMNERLAVARMFIPNVMPLMALAARVEYRGGRAIDHAVIRDKLATFYCDQQAVQHTISRVMTGLIKGREPGPEASIIKIVDANREYEMASLALDLSASLDPQGNLGHSHIDEYLDSPGTRIAGGTEEILLNLIAERVLGLPAEPRSDRHVPFAELA